MKSILFIVLVLIGLFFTFLMGVDGVYVGLFATEKELEQYPWGSNFGWPYLNKTNYMLSGVLKAFISWLPLIVFVGIKHLTSSSKMDSENAAL